MSHLPRTGVLAKKNLNRHKKNSELKKQMLTLTSLCDKYNVKPLSITSSKFIAYDGSVTNPNQITIKGNLRAGIMIITSNESTTSEDVYDIIQIEREKKKRDAEKNIENQKKSQMERDRILQQQLKQVADEKNETGEPSTDSPVGPPTDNPVGPPIDMMETRTKHVKTTGNKFFRNCMKDIKGKFKLHILEQYRYAEFKLETTYMVIENVDVYKMDISTKETYYLVVGDLQLKSGIIKQIDPAYNSDKVADEHTEFMEKMQQLENVENENLDDIPELVELPNNDDVPALIKVENEHPN